MAYSTPPNTLLALNIVHLYWSSLALEKKPAHSKVQNSTLIPDEIVNNVWLWSQHLQPTGFIPILWVNDAVYQDILNLKTVPTDSDITTNNVYACTQVPSYLFRNEKSLLKKATLRYIEQIVGSDFFNDPEKMCYWHRMPRTYSGMAKNTDVFVINFEQFICNARMIAESPPEIRQLFRWILHYYRTANKTTIFAFAKDSIVDIFLRLMGGLYFDADIQPRLPFFNSIIEIVNLLVQIKLFNLLQALLANLEGLPFTFIPTDYRKSKKGESCLTERLDVEMRFSLLRCTAIPALNAEHTGIFIRIQDLHDDKLLAEFKDEYHQYKQETSINRLYFEQPKEKEHPHFFSWISIPYLMRKYSEYPPSLVCWLANYINPANIARGSLLLNYLASMVTIAFRQTYIGLYQQNDVAMQEYKIFYEQEFLHRFSQVYSHAPSSVEHDGYHRIENLYIAGKRYYQQRLLRHTTHGPYTQEATTHQLMIKTKIALKLVEATLFLLAREKFPLAKSIKFVTKDDNYVIIHEAIALHVPDNIKKYQQVLGHYLEEASCLTLLNQMQPENLFMILDKIKTILTRHVRHFEGRDFCTIL